MSVSERQINDKFIDPMKLDQATRDKFPKTNLVGGYIGDHVPLCEDLPSKHHLRKGATYRALGSVPQPEWQDDMVSKEEEEEDLVLLCLYFEFQLLSFFYLVLTSLCIINRMIG